MRIIAIEEHFCTQEYLNCLRSNHGFPRREILQDENLHKIERVWHTPDCFYTIIDPDNAARAIVDTGEGRLQAMDKAQIAMQVLSLATPGIELFESSNAILWAKKINDKLAQIVKQYPSRYAGFATLPWQDPLAAADELERAVFKLGMKGALVNSNVRGEYLDEPKFWGVFEKAEKLGVPIYIHPREPSQDMIKPFTKYPGLWAAFWGYGMEAGFHAVRLICSGIFDKYPRLKIIIGHMGEAIPFWLWRMDNKWPMTPMSKKLSRKPSEYMRDNFKVTTSGMNSEPALMCAYQTLGADNILFAADHPFEPSEASVKFIQQASISESDKEKIFHLNAEKLLEL
jgi:predicted TIM-barrel fold metal-dependent hydrolase